MREMKISNNSNDVYVFVDNIIPPQLAFDYAPEETAIELTVVMDGPLRDKALILGPNDDPNGYIFEVDTYGLNY